MAPVDRHERRQQRVRGAGPSSVQTNFGFSIAGLGAKPSKQSSLPPQRSSRRTPTPSLKTPRSAKGSARRYRSASVQRSTGSVKKHATPTDRTVTPQLGKRKRDSKHAQASEDDGEPDELSPDREDEVRSIEKSRKVAGTVSPIREDVDDVPDELSVLDEGASSIRRPGTATALVSTTPASVVSRAKSRVSSGGTAEKTPIGDRIGSMSISSRTTIVRRSKSIEPSPKTPALLPNGRPRVSSASHFGPAFTTPASPPEPEDSEDELSPPQPVGSTPRTVSREQPTETVNPEEEQMELDELSSPAQPASVVRKSLPPASQQSTQLSKSSSKNPERGSIAPPIKKRGRPKRVVMDEEDEVQSTPATTKPPKKSPLRNHILGAQQEGETADLPDEITPEAARTKRRPEKTKTRAHEEEVVEVSSAEESDDYEPEEEAGPIRVPRPVPTQKVARPAGEHVPRKRQKFSGPKQAISVMRIKGSTVRGITVADTTRTILEQNIDHQVTRMAERMQKVPDASRRKQIRGEINLALAFRESLIEKLLDLQDANDTLSAGFKKGKLLKHDNIERRKEILALQNNRQEIALELDDEQAIFDGEKEKAEMKSQLSANMFEIQAAIQSGRERAKQEGREDEGPEMPLSMLIGMVGRDVGSVGGGLSEAISGFNSGLERAAGWLEGRA